MILAVRMSSYANATMQASAETTMATAGTADLYITKLEEMGDYAKLSADDQQEYRNVLTLLCDLIPDLAGYIDTTTGKIQGGTTALRGCVVDCATMQLTRPARQSVSNRLSSGRWRRSVPVTP